MNTGRLLAVLTLLALLGGELYWSGQRHPARPVTAVVPAALPAAPLPVAPPPRPNLGASEFRQLSVKAMEQAVPVYTYHDIIRSRSQPGAVWFDCTLPEFEAQMQFLKDHGAHPVTLAQLQAHLTLGTALPPHAVVLTFDDNYQGFYDLAYPVLKRYGYPGAMFVHTDYVGVQTGDHPKMTWDELEQLDREGQVTIGAHTRSHPADLAKLSVAQQDEELRGSKAVLEQRLGHVINFQSYANGKGDAVTFERARLAGYTLGFLEFWGPVEQSPDIMQLNRYIHIQMERGWDEAYGPDALPVAVNLPLRTGARQTRRETPLLTYRRGGQLSLLLGDRAPPDPLVQASASGRTPVLTLPSPSADPAASGPTYDPVHGFTATTDPAALSAAEGLPMVAWTKDRLAIVPFASGVMNREDPLKAFLPGLQGAFVADTWLVHGGKALSAVALSAHPLPGDRRLRLRSVLGLTADGEVVLGSSRAPMTVLALSRAVATLGLQEAVLVSSGPSATLGVTTLPLAQPARALLLTAAR